MRKSTSTLLIALGTSLLLLSIYYIHLCKSDVIFESKLEKRMISQEMGEFRCEEGDYKVGIRVIGHDNFSAHISISILQDNEIIWNDEYIKVYDTVDGEKTEYLNVFHPTGGNYLLRMEYVKINGSVDVYVVICKMGYKNVGEVMSISVATAIVSVILLITGVYFLGKQLLKERRWRQFKI